MRCFIVGFVYKILKVNIISWCWMFVVCKFNDIVICFDNKVLFDNGGIVVVISF